MIKLIIDTDPGVDDAMAIQMAINSPEFDILGLTTVFGNVDIELVTTNALRLLELAGKNHIPVSKGAGNPLMGKFIGGVPFVHGEDGQGNTWGFPSKSTPIELPAAEFLIETISKFPDEITIAALGPLTNLALALNLEPLIQKLVKEVVLMGGNAFCAGNATPTAEANMYSDPEAADIVLGANWKVTMIGLDVTQKTILKTSDIQEIATVNYPLNNHVMSAYKFYQEFFFRVNKINGTFLHDSSVFAYLIRRNLYKTVSYPVRVETANCISKGKVWPSLGESDHEGGEALNPWAERPNVTICVDVDAKEVIQLVKRRLIN